MAGVDVIQTVKQQTVHPLCAVDAGRWRKIVGMSVVDHDDRCTSLRQGASFGAVLC